MQQSGSRGLIWPDNIHPVGSNIEPLLLCVAYAIISDRRPLRSSATLTPQLLGSETRWQLFIGIPGWDPIGIVM